MNRENRCSNVNSKIPFFALVKRWTGPSHLYVCVCVFMGAFACVALTDASAFPKASPVWELLAAELCARFAVTHTHTQHRGKRGMCCCEWGRCYIFSSFCLLVQHQFNTRRDLFVDLLCGAVSASAECGYLWFTGVTRQLMRPSKVSECLPSGENSHIKVTPCSLTSAAHMNSQIAAIALKWVNVA